MDFFFRLSRQLSCRASSKLGLGAVMKKLFFANAALAALIAAPAMAADMPIVAPPVYKAPFSWSGCYGGFNAGYIGTLDRYDNSPSGAYSTIFTSAQIAQGQTSRRPDGSSYTGGVQLGFNYQWGAAVWGIEGDFNGSGSGRADGRCAVQTAIAGIYGMNFEFMPQLK
jgi:opacity protein-like surface antigen